MYCFYSNNNSKPTSVLNKYLQVLSNITNHYFIKLDFIITFTASVVDNYSHRVVEVVTIKMMHYQINCSFCYYCCYLLKVDKKVLVVVINGYCIDAKVAGGRARTEAVVKQTDCDGLVEVVLGVDYLTSKMLNYSNALL